MPKQTVEDAATDYVYNMDAHSSYEEVARIEGREEGFKVGAAWQKQQGIDWISVKEKMPAFISEMAPLELLITDGKRIKIGYMWNRDVIGSGAFHPTHWAYINLPKTD